MNIHAQDAQRAASRSPNTSLRLFSLVEAMTLLLLLFVAVPFKHVFGNPIGVSLMGPIHGFVFLAFGWSVAQSVGLGNVTWRKGLVLVLAASLPFGGFYSWWSLR